MDTTHRFLEQIFSFGDKQAVIHNDRVLLYSVLHEEFLGWRRVLSERGIAPGECVAVLGEFSEKMISLLLALFDNGNIVIPILSINSGDEAQYLDVACAQKVIRFDKSHTAVFSTWPEPPEHPILQKLKEDAEPGIILFTSGSTGKFKASVHSLSMLLEHILARKKAASYRTMVFLLLDHIGGINTLLNVLASGGTAVFLRDRSAEHVCETIERYKIQLLPTTPTFINMLLISGRLEKYDLQSLELITYGTEPMLPGTLSSICKALPSVRFKQTYGLTETGILPTKSESADSLWLKVSGDATEIKIVDGLLWIRSTGVMLGYLNAPSPFDDDGWFNTGDMVDVKDGYIRILGRKSEIINVGGEKVFPSEVENVIQELHNIKDVVVYAKQNPLLGSVVAAKVTLCVSESSESVERRIIDRCKMRLLPYKVPMLISVTDDSLHSKRFKKARKGVPA